MVAIVDNRPKTMNLLDYCDCYIAHELEVISRRTRFNLEKDKTRANIVNGLIKAISILDEVVDVIRHSNDKAAKRIVKAQKKFGKIKGLNLKVLDPGKTRKIKCYNSCFHYFRVLYIYEYAKIHRCVY